MNNSRRFTPAGTRPSAPSTPRSANRVLPTPPTSATPAFRVSEDSMDRNSEGVNITSRPQTAPIASAQPGVRPKLPIEGFAKNKRPQPGRGMNSPARPSRVPVQSVVDAEHPARPPRIFGQSNGLLPALSPPPPLPALLTRTTQQNIPARFSSPFSPPEDPTNAGNHDVEQEQDELDSPGPHTSASGPLDGPTIYQRALQAHSSTRRRPNTPVPEFQDELEGSGMESPSPAKRRAEHGHQVPTKRMRSTLNQTHGQNLDDDGYPSQEPLSTAPQPSQATLPHGYYSTSLEAYIEAHQSEWIAAQKRWETCTMEEWQNGPKELTAELEKVMDMVKTFMAKRMEVYAGINKDVQTHKARLDGRDAQLAKEKGRLIKQAGGLAGGFIPC